jgi:hypothetical protein
MLKDFGIIVACSAQSVHLAEGCCASIRHFLGDTPICVLVDGDITGAKLRDTYGVRVINRDSAIDPELKARSFGWGLTKMIAFWESPWEYFLSLDPDTIVWGDVPALFDRECYDAVLDQQFARDAGGVPINPILYEFMGLPSPDAGLRSQVVDRCIFDTAAIERLRPEFPWRKYLFQYAWTGVFFARRGLLDREEYLELAEFSRRNPGVFLAGEMGLLNFMLFHAAERKLARIVNIPMQVLVCEEDERELVERFPTRGGMLPDRAHESAVIHWTGPRKPSLGPGVWSDPMNAARLKFQRDAWSRTGRAAEDALRAEEKQAAAFAQQRRHSATAGLDRSA